MGRGKSMKMLQCVLCLESSMVLPYLINCLSQRQKVAFRFVGSEGSVSPPAIFPQAILCRGGGVREVLLWKGCLLRTISMNYRFLPPTSCCCFLLLPFLTLILSTNVKVTQNLRGVRSKGQKGIRGSSLRRDFTR